MLISRISLLRSVSDILNVKGLEIDSVHKICNKILSVEESTTSGKRKKIRNVKQILSPEISDETAQVL